MTDQNSPLVSRRSRLDTLLLVACLAIVMVIGVTIYLRQAGYMGRYVAPVRVGDITTRPVSEPLLAAIGMGDEATVKRLLDSGVSPDSTRQLGSGTRSRVTALQSAAGSGNVRIVRLLLDYGADINAPGIFESTAMSFTAWGGHVDVVRLLIERGAAVNPQGKSRSYPLANAKYGLSQRQKGNGPLGNYWRSETEFQETIAALEQAGGREGPWWPPQKPAWWVISWWPF